jgi:hypothetical protein
MEILELAQPVTQEFLVALVRGGLEPTKAEKLRKSLAMTVASMISSELLLGG